jgi:hypothetical protein
VNELRAQGLEVHVATTSFRAGTVDVKPGDWIIRGDQPYRTLADMYFAIQNYAPENPAPYDDTGWTFPLMRDVTITPVTDKALLDQPMTMLASDARAAGGVSGTGSVIVVDNTADNNIAAFRFKLASTRMEAAEDDFDADGHHFRAGAMIIRNADRAAIEPLLASLGLSGYAMASAPAVKTHSLDVPRIGYVHSWSRTQDEGWVRAALDTYGIPYTYFGDVKLREGNLRAKYDVIIIPHIGGTAQSMVNGVAKVGDRALPYRRTAQFQALGTPDSTDDIRGGMGVDGLMNLYQFVQQGGTLITEGATSTIFPDYNLTPGVTVQTPDKLFARGSIMRGIIADMKSPIVYGYGRNQLPVYFSQGPVLAAGGAGGGFGGFGRGAEGITQNITPMATPQKLSVWDPDATSAPARGNGAGARGGRGGEGGAPQGGGRGGRGAAAFGAAFGGEAPRVIMQFPQNPADMLLSGVLTGGEALSGRAQVVDEPLGKGHVVMFAIRPFWRWQTQGTYMLGFNAIMNWNHLDAGKAGEASDH